MYGELFNALLHRGHSSESIQREESTDIGKYMTNIEQMVRFHESVLDDDDAKQGIQKFLQSNEFTLAPLVNDSGQCVQLLRLPVSKEKQDGGFELRSPQSLDITEHIFGAILFNVVSRDLVVPIEKNGKLAGIFSISDLVQDDDFSRAILYNFTKEKQTENVSDITRNFIATLKRVNAIFNGDFSKT